MANPTEHDNSKRWVAPADINPAVQVVPVLLGVTIITTVVLAIFLF
jgi:hypothetical protein